MTLKLERFVTGPIETNTYVLSNDQKKCLIFDPSNGCDRVLDYISQNNFTPLAVVITHGHFDHIGGIPEIVDRFSEVRIMIPEVEKSSLSNPAHNMSTLLGVAFSYKGAAEVLEEGAFEVGGFSGTVFLVPGHSPGGSALLIDQYLFCGDILFAGSIGRTDFPGGNHTQLIQGIKEKLLTLPDETVVCPGHMGRTTIGREKRVNPYFTDSGC